MGRQIKTNPVLPLIMMETGIYHKMNPLLFDWHPTHFTLNHVVIINATKMVYYTPTLFLRMGAGLWVPPTHKKGRPGEGYWMDLEKLDSKLDLSVKY